MTEAHKSSQTMTPIKSYSTVLMGWKRTTYLENIKTLDCGYHGGKGETEYFEIKGLANIDIDNEEDFQLAEVAIQLRDGSYQFEKLYFDEMKEERTEVDVPSILQNHPHIFSPTKLEEKSSHEIYKKINSISNIDYDRIKTILRQLPCYHWLLEIPTTN